MHMCSWQVRSRDLGILTKPCYFLAPASPLLQPWSELSIYFPKVQTEVPSVCVLQGCVGQIQPAPVSVTRISLFCFVVLCLIVTCHCQSVFRTQGMEQWAVSVRFVRQSCVELAASEAGLRSCFCVSMCVSFLAPEDNTDSQGLSWTHRMGGPVVDVLPDDVY